MARFSINNLDFERDFGVFPKYRLPASETNNENIQRFNGEVEELETEAFVNTESEVYSAFGTPILGAVKLDDLLLEHGMFQITGSNHIIETDVSFLDGTINEYFGQNDYKLFLSGYLIGDSFQEAVTRANALDQLCKQKSNHRIYNSLMNSMQVDDIVIRDWRIEPVEGGQHYFTYRIDAKSERPIKLEL